MSVKKTAFLNQLWYGARPSFLLLLLLLPFSMLYRLIVIIRRFILTRYFQTKFAVPIIVVGNISVGGVGKTPLVIELAKQLTKQGLSVGIVSRGYGSRIKNFPHLVCPDSLPSLVGDEPLLLAKRTACPVVIAPQRVMAVDYLLEQGPIDVIISDDGLQHYRMGRWLEIVVVDGLRGIGNGWCLPAGPLREPRSRLKQADLLVINGEDRFNLHKDVEHYYTMHYQMDNLIRLSDGESTTLDDFIRSKRPIAAVAGIGHPERFFNMLKSAGLNIVEHPFPDHYEFQESDFLFAEDIVFMTEKDAVKCKQFARSHWYFLSIKADLPSDFWCTIDNEWSTAPNQKVF